MKPDRWLAVIAYLLPVVGWLYLWIYQRNNSFAMFHLRQAIGIFLAIIFTFLAWVVVAWVLAWIPYVFVIGVTMYALVILVVILAVLGWLIGIVNALRLNVAYVPVFGRWANRLLEPYFSPLSDAARQKALKPIENR